jgi:predicted ATPase
MAAARLRVLSPAQIADSLSDRFALLTRVESDTVPRHETLEVALDWSYELLEPDIRLVFDRLSVFAGAFDLEAADAVAGLAKGRPRMLDAITALVESSMLTTVGWDTLVVRYRMLETLREYAARRLQAAGEEDEVHEAHAGHFLALAEQAKDAIGTPQFASWTKQLQTIYPDLRLALEWSLSQHPRANTLRVAPTLFHIWIRTGDGREAAHWGRRMLDDAEGAPTQLRAAAHLALSFSGNILGEPESARLHTEASIRLYRESGDRHGLVTALFGGGNVALQGRRHRHGTGTLAGSPGDLR